MKLLLIWIFVLLLSTACSPINKRPDFIVHPFINDDVREIKLKAQECKEPAVAKLNFSSDFKYGCFCGKNHPTDSALKKALHNITTEPLAAPYIAKYYAIEPIDDIDKACRNHDLCWLLNGEGDRNCNEILRKQLRKIHDHFQAVIREEESNDFTTSWRCQILANDMNVVFFTIFVEDKSNPGHENPGVDIIRLAVATPLLVSWYAMLRTPIWASDPYPYEHERCVMESVNVKP